MLTDLLTAAFTRRAIRTDTTFDTMIIPLLRKTIKLFIVALGLIYVADSFDIELLPLLGSLGLAGLAISFAAQDMVKNLFGGLSIFMDQPFKVGERIVYKGFDGVIEEIGFRITRLRTLEGHLVTIPNGGITNDPIQNIGRRPFIRRIVNVTITYDTPAETIEQAVRIIKDILEEPGIKEPIHGRVGADEFPPRVYFNDYNAASLNIFVIYWHFPPTYWEYMEHAERFNKRLFEEYAKAGIDFAFPTQTLYLAGDPNRPLSVGLENHKSPE
jgi:MscS family membrane protein